MTASPARTASPASTSSPRNTLFQGDGGFVPFMPVAPLRAGDVIREFGAPWDGTSEDATLTRDLGASARSSLRVQESKRAMLHLGRSWFPVQLYDRVVHAVEERCRILR